MIFFLFSYISSWLFLYDFYIRGCWWMMMMMIIIITTETNWHDDMPVVVVLLDNIIVQNIYLLFGNVFFLLFCCLACLVSSIISIYKWIVISIIRLSEFFFVHWFQAWMIWALKIHKFCLNHIRGDCLFSLNGCRHSV